MNSNLKITSALLISGLFLTQMLTAQVAGDVRATGDVRNSQSATTTSAKKTAPVAPPNNGVKTYPTDGQRTYPMDGQRTYPTDGQKTYPTDGQRTYPTDGDDDDAVSEGIPPQPVPLELEIRGHDWHVTGGIAGGRVAILMGLELSPFTLPGGAEITIVPLAVLSSGVFGQFGEFIFTLGYDAKAVQGLKVHFQAISEDAEGRLRTSGHRTLDFTSIGR